MDIEVIRVEIAKLELKAGDVLAVKFIRDISADQVERIKAVLQNAIPDGVGVVAYPASDIELSIMKDATK